MSTNSTPTLASVKIETLITLNRMSHWSGRTPLTQMPGGSRKDKAECPVSEALRRLGFNKKVRVYGNMVCGLRVREANMLEKAWEGEPGAKRVWFTWVSLPTTVQRFIKLYDDGHYPVNTAA